MANRERLRGWRILVLLFASFPRHRISHLGDNLELYGGTTAAHRKRNGGSRGLENKIRKIGRILWRFAVIQFPGLIASENDWLESLVQWVVVDATSRGTILFFWRLGALVEAKHESDGRLPPQAQLKEPHSSGQAAFRE